MKAVIMCEKPCDTGAPIKIPTVITTKNVKLKQHLDALSECNSTVDQQKLLKNLPKLIVSTDDGNVIANLISCIFLTIDPKHPLKKTVTRVLLTMHEELVTSAMALQIISLITECTDTEKFTKLCKENDVLINLNSCFNNFPPGVEALSSIINLVFIFACNNFLKSVAYLYLENEIDKHTLHIYIYNASKFLVALLNQCDISQHMTELSFKLLLASYKIITDEHISFNTKANCGILLIMAAIHTPEKENDEKGGGLATLLKLEMEEGGSLLGNTLLLSKNYTAKICIFSGILNTVPAEVICADKLDDAPAPIYIFQSLLESASKHTGKPLEIMEISRTFISLSRLLFNMEITDIDVIFKPGLDYIWTHLDHFSEVVRHDTITVLKNFVKIAVKHEKNGHKRLVDQIVAYISLLLENNNTNFKALAIVSNETTCDYLLNIFPDLPAKLLLNLDNISIAQHVCSTYESIMEQYSKEQPEKWIDVWVKQIATLIQESEDDINIYYQKIFTAAFKLNQSVIKLLSYEDNVYNNPNKLAVLLGCFISARNINANMKFYDKDVSNTYWNGMLEYEMLYVMTCHQTPEIRIATLTLVIECQKTTEIFPEWDLNFLIRFLHYNITTQMPNVRHQMIGLYKKAFARYRESFYVIQRNIKNILSKIRAIGNSIPKLDEEFKMYQKQESYYKEFIVDIFEEELIKGLFPEVNYYRRSVALELLLCMRSTINESDFDQLWKKDYIILLYQALDDSYESNIIMATKLLLGLPKFMTFYQNKESLKNEIKNAISLAASIKSTSTTSAAYCLQVYKNSHYATEVMRELHGNKTEYDETLILINYLMDEIENGLQVAKDNILIASKCAPIYGLVFCIRHLIQKEHIEEIHPKIIPNIIELCGRLSQIASPIVNTSSPEGFMPTDSENVVDETVTSQMVLVYAWRTVKEISLLLGEISFKNSKGDQIIPAKCLSEIADYFITLFMETKHRGAYEQAYLGFSKFCSKLWNSGTTYSEWPVNWLTTILEVLAGKKDDFTKLCSTRRSAGVPFVIQSILTTEPQNRGNESFHYCMKTLLEIADDFSEQNEKAAIHSMNILRALYKHNQLGELVTPYVAKGVMISIIGFSHSSWGVRNAATLMFSALMTRIFGVQRTKDSEDISIKNRLSARVFFMRYPELYEFMLEKLRVFTKEMDNTSLYPLLFILARLYPSAEKSEMLQYLPFINPCLGSSILKMRELAAQASISAMPTDDYVTYIKASFSQIVSKLPGNTLHGVLLQLNLLLKNLPNSHEDFDIVSLVRGSFWIVEKAGISIAHISATLYMEILILVIRRFKEKCYGRDEFVELMSTILQTLNYYKFVSTSKTNFELTKLALYLHLLTSVIDLPSVCREKFVKDVIVAALYSTNEDYQLFALNCIYYLFEGSYCVHNSYTNMADEEKSELEYAIINPVSDDMKMLMIKSIQANTGCLNFFTDLFHILKTRRKEYAMRVCSIIPYLPCMFSSIRPKNCPVILDKQLILNFLICETLEIDSDMFCAIMPIITSLVSETKQKLDYRRLVQNVLKPFSTPENSTEERMAVCHFLLQNTKFLYDDDILPVECIVEVWYITITLLQDNEVSVRDKISKITSHIRYPVSPLVVSPLLRRFVFGMYVISEKTLEDLLQVMPDLIPFEEAMKIYLTLALKPKYQSKPANSDSPEVFDKGELNMYEEGDPLVILAIKCLKRCLWTLEDNLSYEDKSIFIEEHTLLVATRLFNLFYGCHISYARSEDKLLSMLVLKEVMNYLEARAVGAGDFRRDFTYILEKKFMSIFSQSPYMFKYCRVGTFLKCVFSFDNN